MRNLAIILSLAGAALACAPTEPPAEFLPDTGKADTASPTGQGNIARFVEALYQDVHHRSGTANEVGPWAEEIEDGHLSAGEVARRFIQSLENRRRLVRQFYATYLGRDNPSASEVASHENESNLKKGDPIPVMATFLSSNEFFEKAGGTTDDFIKAMYQAVHGRPAGSDEIPQWRNQSRAQVARAFLTSPEFEKKLIKRWFDRYLDRAPTTSERNDYLDLLGHMNHAQAQATILTLPEYYLGHGQCEPTDCDDEDAECGELSDGCGDTLECGTCSGEEVCGGAGEDNQCGCEPASCEDADCGFVEDSCGGESVFCGFCAGDEVCGGGGIANVCALPLPNSGVADGFEDGEMPGWTTRGRVQPLDIGLGNARAGRWAVRIGPVDSIGISGDHELMKTYDVPASGRTELRFWHKQHCSDRFFDDMIAEIRVPEDDIQSRIFDTCNDDGLWREEVVDLSGFEGKKVQLYFNADNDFSQPSHFFVDEVRLVTKL